MIRLLIFDVGGVIDTFDEQKYIKYLSKNLGLDPKKFRSALIPELDKMEVGKSTVTVMKKMLAKKFKISERQLQWDEDFVKINTVNYDVIRLINKLSKKYRIAILTNVSMSRHDIKMRMYLHKIKYEKLFASCYLRMAKPGPKIYGFVLKKMHVNANETLFVDNLKLNTDGAKKVGMNAIQFKNYNQLKKALIKIGIS